MAVTKKGIWLAPKLEKSADEEEILVGEEEEEKINFSLRVEAPEKGKGNPILARTAASTNANSANSNFGEGEAGGANYSHVANSFIVGPANAQKFASSGTRYALKVQGERVTRTSKRSQGRGK